MKKEELIAAGCMVPDTLQEAMRNSGREMKVIEGSREEVYFSYEETLFAIAVRLSVTEMLFSSFYFSAIQKMVWSSFEGKFLLFWYGEAEKCKS